jgi:hypothetical protein
MTLPLGARCFIAGVAFSKVFYSIEEGVNDRLYIAIRHNGSTGGYIFLLNSGNYGGVEFAQELQTKLRKVDTNCQVSYIQRQGRIQTVMRSGYTRKSFPTQN